MKKLISFYDAWKAEQENQKNKNDFTTSLSGLMKITFNERSTAEAISLNKKYNALFEQELAKRGLDAAIETADVEHYFISK